MAASAGQHWPTAALFVIALSSAAFSSVSSRVVGAGKLITVFDVLGYIAGAVAQLAVPTAQALNFALPSWAVVIVAVVGGMLGVGSHGPFAPPKAGS